VKRARRDRGELGELGSGFALSVERTKSLDPRSRTLLREHSVGKGALMFC
jgi:hypothetical protein